MMKHYKEHIYSLEDRQESDISASWQVLQVLFFTCCIVFGYSVCFTFGLATGATNYNCILYSELSFVPNSTDKAGRANNIKAVNSEFPEIYCELVIYTPMVLSTFACFLAVMFAYCGRGGAGNQSMQETWRIIMPSVFFNLTGFCLSAYTANVFQSGVKQFLRSVSAAWRTPVVALEDISDLRLDDVNVGRDLIRYLSLTKHATWLNVTFWGLNFLWILLRLLFNVDFQLVRTTIHVYPGKQNIARTSKLPSVSDTSADLHHGPSVRFRTVKFTPSTVAPRSKQEQDLSPTTMEETEEIEIAKVDYNNIYKQ